MRKTLWFIVYSYVIWPWIEWFYRRPTQPCIGSTHNDIMTSNVGHLGSESVRLLVGNNMHASMGHHCCITSPTRQREPYRESVKNSSRPYGV